MATAKKLYQALRGALRAALVLLIACSGPPEGGPPGPLATTPVPEDLKQAAVAAIIAYFKTLPHSSRDDDNQRLLGFVRGRPEFVDATLEQGTVFARFKDGELLPIINNLDTAAAGPAGAAPQQRPGAQPPARGVQRRALSASGRAYLFYGGDCQPQEDAVCSVARQAAQDVAAAFARTGDYQAEVREATLDNLRAVDGADALFYMGHFTMQLAPLPEFVLATSTPISETSAATAEDLKADRIGRALTVIDLPLMGRRELGMKSHFFLKKGFIERYWDVRRGAVVLVNGCFSGGAGSLRDALLAKGAGAYLGWSFEVQVAEVADSARLFFSTMLGANLPPYDASPPNRPFGAASTFEYMQRQQRPDHGFSYARSNVTSELSLSPGESSAILEPSIRNLLVRYSGDDTARNLLEIGGEFGEDPGEGQRSVTVAGRACSNVTWTPQHVTCDITDIHGGGEVLVTTQGHRSNPVALSAWRIRYTFTRKRSIACNPAGAGDVLTVTFEGEVGLLADLHPSRGAPFERPQTPAETRPGVAMDTDSSLRITAVAGRTSSCYPNGDFVIEPNVGLPYRVPWKVDKASDKPGYWTSLPGISFGPSPRVTIYQYGRVADAQRLHNPVNGTWTAPLMLQWQPRTDPAGPLIFELAMDGDFALGRGSMERRDSDPDDLSTLTWPAASLQHPPDRGAPQ